MGDHTFFFYGTLMAPQILHRVCHGRPDPEPWQKAMLKIKPAILHGYRRHRVRGADYPAIVPAHSTTTTSSSSSTTPDPSSKSTSDPHPYVLGTLVSGLTDGDVYRLDLFEGSQYEKRRVRVRTLHEAVGLGGRQEASVAKKGDQHLRDVLDAAGAEMADEGDEVEAMTYVWVGGQEELEDREWDFETFKRERMRWWVDADESEW
ncbi:putative disease resistance protein Aig2 [Thermoascus aurantiacus ATCC 26904]